MTETRGRGHDGQRRHLRGDRLGFQLALLFLLETEELTCIGSLLGCSNLWRSLPILPSSWRDQDPHQNVPLSGNPCAPCIRASRTPASRRNVLVASDYAFTASPTYETLIRDYRPPGPCLPHPSYDREEPLSRMPRSIRTLPATRFASSSFFDHACAGLSSHIIRSRNWPQVSPLPPFGHADERVPKRVPWF